MTAQVPPPVTGRPVTERPGTGRPPTGESIAVTPGPAVQGPEPAELRRALLTAPAAATGGAVLVVAVVAAVLDDHHAAAAVSALVAGAVVVVASTITGVLGVRSATARPEAVFAAAMVSFMTKILVFAVALAAIGSVEAARRVPFAVAAIVAVLVWLAVEVVLVARLRSTGAAVFGPPVTTGTEPGTGSTGGVGEGSSGSIEGPAPASSAPARDFGSGPPVG